MAAKSEVMNVAGLLMNIIVGLVKAVQSKGGTDDDIRRLAGEEGKDLFEKIADIIVGGARQTFKVSVDYTKSLAEMVAAGHYDWTNSDINADHFPVEGKGQKEVELVLFHFGKVMTSEQAVSEMDKAGYRPAFIEELLALGASQPEFQKEFPIMALGSVWRDRDPSGGRCVSYLLPCFSAERRLGLCWSERGWNGDGRFAAVRK